MKRNNEFKEIITKNRTFYYFDDIINVNDLDLDNISFDEKSNENILIYHATNKTPYHVKPLRIIFDKLEGYIGKYGKTKYQAIFHSYEKYESIFDKIR